MTYIPEIVNKGKDNGDDMVIRYRTARGTDVFGLSLENDRQFELGPTWCYLVCNQHTTLIDTGHPYGLDILERLLVSTGRKLSDINRVIVSHSHEDHDGNLAEIMSRIKAELWAHSLYKVMISYFPEIKGAIHPELPGSCRNCVMPEKVYGICVKYQKERSSLNIDRSVDDDTAIDDFSFVHTPGHTPDSICIVLENEMIFTGDTVLPEITPHPSLAEYFYTDNFILPEHCRDTNDIYGLMSYIKSLQKVAQLTEGNNFITLPAHKLYSRGKFNLINSCEERAREIIQFHIDRCDDIIRIIGNRPVGIKEIVVNHFPARQLRGYGKMLAEKEIMAHLEILEESGDIQWVETGGEKLVKYTGLHNYRDRLAAYLKNPV